MSPGQASWLPGQLSHHSAGWLRASRPWFRPWFLGSLGEVQRGATPGSLTSINHCWASLGQTHPAAQPWASCLASQSQLPYLPRVPKGLHKLILEKPQAEGQPLSSLGLCGQLDRPQPPQLERPCRMTLTFRLCILPDLVPTPTSSLSGHATLARHRSSVGLQSL